MGHDNLSEYIREEVKRIDPCCHRREDRPQAACASTTSINYEKAARAAWQAVTSTLDRRNDPNTSPRLEATPRPRSVSSTTRD
jgi:hypothetical protein